ncbi:major facilitator superfamily domain-containing protein [Flammula alnicola]|nr:major facilitator superfamily domain-containing protein [Flammula alnicola]
MTDIAEKSSDYNSGTESDNGSQRLAIFERPKGLKGFYYNPVTQVVMLGFVCFMCPGLFNALTGLGGGGQVDPTTSANANSALYATFAAGAFFSGSIHNKLGSRLTLLLGTTGYSLYIGAYLAMNIHPHAGAFVVASGAILGICAGLLWTAQGSMMLSYATEDEKGKFIGIFWGIFNLGAVVGASVSLGQNFHSTSHLEVGNGTYIGFLVLTLIGVTIPIFMADPEKMIRTDGTKVTTPRHPSWKIEIYGLWVTLKTDPMVILLFPMFFASNWFYTWQFNEYNQALFNIRARSLNNLVYWLAQIVGSISIGFLLDQKYISRRIRAFSAWAVLLCMIFIVHTWAFFYQRQYTRASLPPDSPNKYDIFSHGYAGRIMLYIFCGLLDAMWQTTAYWIIGAMSNDPAKLAYFAGFYKSIQSAGAAGAWRADAVKTPFMNLFISTWVLLVAGLVFALPMLYLRVKDHTELADEALCVSFPLSCSQSY